ncbi:hypothetical protein ZHAS_00010328 [Anopheles sinensis]|uniref:Uncharacterized protein n=1 Tax=Anopheles sinensis TaxID=74873 RepID=A0A084VXB4_ANOSI|nr:hypothetical protein ZHAS_00010328 [Anopheles sinensis]
MSSERRWKDTFRVDFSAWASKPTREEVITMISKMIMTKECVVRTHLSQVNQTVYVQMSSLEQAQEVVERSRGKLGKKINGERLHKEKPTRTQQAGVSENPAPSKKAPEITISKSPSPARDPVAAETSAQQVSVPVHTPAQPPPADNSVLEPMADNATEDSAMQTVPGGLSVDDIVFDIPLDSSSVSPPADETSTLAGVKRRENQSLNTIMAVWYPKRSQVLPQFKMLNNDSEKPASIQRSKLFAPRFCSIEIP